MEPRQDEPTDSRLELVRDGDELAVVGDPAQAEAFLRSEGWWQSAKRFDLQRLRALPGVAAAVADAASEMAAGSGHWLRLTPESAQQLKKYGLMETTTPGVSHAMIGKRGSVQKWLQIEHGPRSLATNPAALSGAAGLMARAATQQAMSEITDYLAVIDGKLDNVARKVDDTVRKDVVGAQTMLSGATAIRDVEGRVTDDSWSELQGLPNSIAGAQGYALLQLKAVADRLEGSKHVHGLAKSAREAQPEVQEWLGFLAQCFQVQDAYDLLKLDRAFEAGPDAVDSCRRTVKAARHRQLEDVATYTGLLLGRMDAAVGTANARIFWNRTKSPEVVRSGNAVAAEVQEFHLLLGVPSEQRSWQPRRLGTAAELGSQTIQKTKDTAPLALMSAGVVTAAHRKMKR